jgi:hypothetical protein
MATEFVPGNPGIVLVKLICLVPSAVRSELVTVSADTMLIFPIAIRDTATQTLIGPTASGELSGARFTTLPSGAFGSQAQRGAMYNYMLKVTLPPGYELIPDGAFPHTVYLAYSDESGWLGDAVQVSFRPADQETYVQIPQPGDQDRDVEFLRRWGIEAMWSHLTSPVSTATDLVDLLIDVEYFSTWHKVKAGFRSPDWTERKHDIQAIPIPDKRPEPGKLPSDQHGADSLIIQFPLSWERTGTYELRFFLNLAMHIPQPEPKWPTPYPGPASTAYYFVANDVTVFVEVSD